MKVHIIGGGNLGVSIALGIAKFSKNNQVTVTRRNTASIQYLTEYGITVSNDNKHNIQEADIVILTIKPYQVDIVLAEILPVIKGKTIASAVSGLSLDMLTSKTNNEFPVIRIMPNIAAQFGESATCISFPEKDREKALPIVDLFQDLGTAPVIDEKLMDAATVLGACGTAYALRYIRASMQAGIEIGFDSQTALAIAAQFGESATCISFPEKDREKALPIVDLFQDLGTAPVIDEKLMDAATVLGACGTAYALRYIRASMQAGIEIGFDSQTALAIAAQTVKGAAKMLLEEKVHPEQLIDRVTTPQGCTIVGLNEMEHNGFSSSLIKGIKTSLKQIKG